MTDTSVVSKSEVIAAGERSLNSLRSAREEMGKAFGWGIADILGGGFIISMIKRGKIDKAKTFVEQAKRDLDVFSSQVEAYGEIQFQDNIFLQVGDFVESLIADIWVQTKISKAKDQLDEANVKVEQALNRIKNS